MRLLEGYVKGRTKEVSLAAMLGALILIGRYITLPIFIPPLHGLEPSVVFYSSAILVLSYPYVWLLSFTMALTSNLPLPAFPTWLIGFHIFYFLSRLMGLRRARYFSFFCSPIVGIILLIEFGWLGILPFEVFFVPIMVKTFAQGILAVLVVPLIIRVLEEFSVIEMGKERIV